MPPLPDYLRKNLCIVFVGYNPSIFSGEAGHHYASPNNRFWTVLHQAGLTPRKYRPLEDESLLELGYGLTNIVARPTRAAADLTKEDYAAGRDLLREKIAGFTPRVVCFVGKGVYREYSGYKVIPWGIQETPVVPGVIDFVAPSTSGLVRMKMEEVVEIYRRLKECV